MPAATPICLNAYISAFRLTNQGATAPRAIPASQIIALSSVILIASSDCSLVRGDRSTTGDCTLQSCQLPEASLDGRDFEPARRFLHGWVEFAAVVIRPAHAHM
jgi:hypothetical protein